MRHRVHGRKLSRSTTNRESMQRNMTRSLFESFGAKDHIITTREKAKFVQPFVERLITLAKLQNLHNYRRGIQILHDKTLVKKLFEEIAPSFRSRAGGYTRVIRVQRRRLGDRASQVLFGFVRDGDAAATAAVVEKEGA